MACSFSSTVVVAEHFEPLLDGGPYRFEPQLVSLRERCEALVLHPGDGRELCLQGLREQVQARGELTAGRLCLMGVLGSRPYQLRAQLALEPLVLRGERLEPRPDIRALAGGAAKRAQTEQHDEQQDANQQEACRRHDRPER